MKKEKYNAPAIKVVAFMAESGFATSGPHSELSFTKSGIAFEMDLAEQPSPSNEHFNRTTLTDDFWN